MNKKLSSLFIVLMFVMSIIPATGGDVGTGDGDIGIKQHNATITISPNIANCEELANTFTVNVKNDADSADDIFEVRIYSGTYGVVGGTFACGSAPTGWTLSDYAGGSGLPDYGYCEYKTAWDGSDVIIPGGDLDFTFDAQMWSEECYSEFLISTLDNKRLEGEHEYNYVNVSIDCTPPEIKKQMGDDVLKTSGPCPPGAGQECWMTQGTIQVHAEDDETCDLGIDYCDWELRVDGVLINSSHEENGANLYFDILFDEDSLHELTITCVDVAGNEITDVELFRVDDTPPVTTKDFVGPQKKECYVEWIDGVTEIELTAVDPDPTGHDCNIGIDETWYMNILAEDAVEQLDLQVNPDLPCLNQNFCDVVLTKVKNNPDHDYFNDKWQLYVGPFQKEEESCHILVYYSVDKLGNEEEMQVNCFFVDKTPPKMSKVIGDPNIPCDWDESVTGDDLVLTLENKDPSTWNIIDDTTKATLQYNDMGPEFKYSLSGKVPLADTKYSLVYYADKQDRFADWGGDNPGALIVEVTSDVNGDVSAAGSKNLGMDLPCCDASCTGPDWNCDPDPDYCDNNNGFDDYDQCSGAKIWLVPSSDYDETTKKLTAWKPTTYLFETDLIDYTFAECYWVRDDNSLPGTPIKLTCTDQLPHPSGDEEVCFRVSYDIEPWLTEEYCKDVEGSMEGPDDDDWCCVDKTATIVFEEDSLHDLEYFCRDAVDKKSEIDLEWFRVDSQKPIIKKDMFGSYLGDCPSGTDIEHGDCYVADDGTSGVEITVYDDMTYPECAVDDVTCTYELWWKGEKIDSGQFTDYKKITFTKDSTHTLIIHCEDALGNYVDDVEEFLVDSTPPETEKEYGEPQKVDPVCYGLCVDKCTKYNNAQVGPSLDPDCLEDCLHSMCTWWITSETPITLTSYDEKVGQDYPDTIYYRNLWFPDNDEICYNVPIVAGDVQTECMPSCHPEYYNQFIDPPVPFEVYSGPFTKTEESCHVIEYYSVDALGNEEIMKWQCVFVDNTAPMGIKEVGEPKIPCEPPEQPGEPYCDGTPETGSCEFYSESQCLAISSCDWTEVPDESYCAGVPDSGACMTYDLNQCAAISGCVISGDYCMSRPDSCQAVVDGWPSDPEGKCIETYGCTWISNEGDDFCAGTPDSCEVVATSWPNDPGAKCLETEGCDWVGGGEEYDCWWVRDDMYQEGTPITLDCEDQGPHPVEQETACFRISFDVEPWLTEDYCTEVGGEMTGLHPEDWCCVYVGDEPFTFAFHEDSVHDLEFYCMDHLGNTEAEVDKEWFKVDSVAPTTTKTITPNPYYDGDVEYIDTTHEITLIAEDGGEVCAVGVDETWYMNILAEEVAETLQLEVDPEKPCLEPDFCDLVLTKVKNNLDNPALPDWQLYEGPFQKEEESCHILVYYSVDELGNEEDMKVNCFFVDKTKPVTTKWYEGPQYPDPITDQTSNPYWINSSTEVILSAVDPGPHPSGVDETWYRDVYLEEEIDWHYCYEDCAEWENDKRYSAYGLPTAPEPYNPSSLAGWLPWTGNPFNKEPESCHIIEYYSFDNVGKVERPNWQCVFVDNSAPDPVKTVGDPKTKWYGEDSIFYPEETAHCWDGTEDQIECWKVTLDTPITLDCIDPEPHPVDHEITCFMVGLDGEDATEDYCKEVEGDMNDEGYCCGKEAPFEFEFMEETEHNLKYYCEDALGNVGPVDEEKFKVMGRMFEIQINKKWNLISVPFDPLDPDVEEVFKDVEDKGNLDGVWTYDAESKQWYVYRPGGVTNNLDEIKTGYGYWVSAYDDDWLLVGGSLYNPGPVVPPSRNLVEGWNLIGYYGTEGEEVYDGPDGDGKMAYCALYSIVKTNLVPLWSSLLTYWEPENPDQWIEYGIILNNNLDPGAGYWIHMKEDGNYAPSTACVPLYT